MNKYSISSFKPSPEIDIGQFADEPLLRRLRGARLLAAGESQAEVARRVGVSRQTVMRWDRVREQGGVEALRRPRQFGRPERLSVEQRAELVQILKGVSMVSTSVWRLLGRLVERATPGRPGARARRAGDPGQA